MLKKRYYNQKGSAFHHMLIYTYKHIAIILNPDHKKTNNKLAK